MYAIVVGAGSIGFHLARELLASGNEAVVIERDPMRADACSDSLGSIVITSDGTEPTVLREAGASRCDLLVATTGNDGVNLVACQVVKHVFNVPRTMSVVWDPENAPLFKHLGVDVTISATELLLAHIEDELPTDSLVHLFSLRGGSCGVVCVHLSPTSDVIGRTVGELALPPGASVTAVIRKDGSTQQASRDLRFEPGDEVLAVTTPEQEEALRQVLARRP